MTEEELEIYNKGYEKGQGDLICMLADFLHISLTFENPIEVAKRIMMKGKDNNDRTNL